MSGSARAGVNQVELAYQLGNILEVQNESQQNVASNHQCHPVNCAPKVLLPTYHPLGVRPRLEERADEGLVAELRRQVDRSLPAVVGEVDVGAVVEKRLASVQSTCHLRILFQCETLYVILSLLQAIIFSITPTNRGWRPGVAASFRSLSGS